MSAVKSREDNLRRRLARHKLNLRQTPARSWLRQHFPIGYTITCSQSQIDLLGTYNRGFEASLEDCEDWARANLDT